MCRSSEFDMKRATAEELKGFEGSDRVEWNSVLGMNAVKVWRSKDAQQLREQFGAAYKSRRCVLKFDHPDSENLRTFGPTPQAEIINLFFQPSLNLQLNVVFGDVASAFCQGKKLQRAAGMPRHRR